MITIKQLQRINKSRGKKWHPRGLEEWSLLEWTGALCGESGEAANFAKKLRRIELELKNYDKRKKRPKFIKASKSNIIKYRNSIAKECADTILYAILTMEVCQVDAEKVIKKVFNTKSIEYGFPERL